MSAMPNHEEPPKINSAESAFWLSIREALLLMVRAIECRHLPGLKKR